MHKGIKNIINHKFGYWTVIKYDEYKFCLEFIDKYKNLCESDSPFIK